MGLYSVISHAISKMTREDTTNPRTLNEWIERVTGIEQDLEESPDIERRQKLETVVADVAARFTSTETDQEEPISQIRPKIYRKRREILTEADKTLDAIQAPPKGHSEEMQKAIANDERAFGSAWEDLRQPGAALLKEVSEVVLNAEPAEEGKLCREMSLENLENERTSSTSSGTHTLQDEERAYEEFKQMVALCKQGKCVSSLFIAISDMGSENEGSPHFIPIDYNFGALADKLTNYDSESFIPDFWSKGVDADRNCVTKSGVWWEWQDPSKKVNDAIKEGHIRFETVFKEVEYVVVLVKKGDVENGMPIKIPRTGRQRAFQHFQQHFPNHIVSQVRQLQKGDDARDVMFDIRFFCHRTNPLFVELKLSAEPAQPTSEVVEEVDVATTGLDKGKGRATEE